jgi:M6 family metalloprotease-like protein
MKRTLFVLLLLITAAMLFSAPLKDMPVTLTQPDGTVLNVLASGDEFHNWLHNENNYTIIQDKNTGWYTWAVQQNGQVTASQYIVGQSDPVALGLENGVNLTPEQIRAKHDQFFGNYPIQRDERAPHFGTVNNLVIFIKFSNSPDFGDPITYYDAMFNTDTQDYNSMRNYFQAVSYDQLDIISHYYPVPNGTTIVCYVDPNPREYYMPWSPSNTMGYSEDQGSDERAVREFTLLANACNYVASQVPTTLNLDVDGDGNADNACFIIQGSTTAWATLLWPHRWVLYGADVYINNARIWDFNFQLESFMDGSGPSVLCHEMFHTLGSPDLYRYYDGTIDPIGNWDLMCGNTNPPQSMSAWMKFKYAEWVPDVPTLTQSGTYTINPVWSPTNNIYRIPSWKINEFYIIEYRKPFGIYDTELPGQGLLIYRLNTDCDGNAEGPPDELYLYRPYGTSNTDNGSVNAAHFSQQTGRTYMNESTVPSGFMSDESPGGLDISEISAAGGETMSFRVNIANTQVTYPVGGETFFSGASIPVTWKGRSTVGYASIEFSSDNGATWQVITNNTQNDGNYTWMNIPVMDENECLIRVTTLSNGAMDVCNGTFTVQSELAMPTPLFPLDQMVNAPTNPTFAWTAVDGAESYTIMVSLDSDFISTIINVLNITDTNYTYNDLMPYTTYYWRVASYAIVGMSDYCANQMFTTGNISMIPMVPSLISPPSSSVNQPRNTLLRWNPAGYAQFYNYQVSTTSYFTNTVEENDSLNALEVRLQPLEPNTRYYWRVRSGNPAGYSYFSAIRNFTTGDFLTANEDEVAEQHTALLQNRPNPFNLSTWIEFQLKDASQPVKLTVFNIRGQVVQVLFSGKAKSSVNRFEWDGKDRQGRPVSNGVYYYKLESGSYKQIRKMLLLK